MGRKRSRSSSRSRSRSRRRHRSSSSDSGSHRHSRSSGHKNKKKSRARSRSRDRHSRSRSRSRSRERRLRRRSHSHERRRRSRSRSRDRDRRGRRSRSPERRSRKKRRSCSRSDSRTRNRHRSRSSSYDSRELDRRRKPSSHDQSPSRGALSTEAKLSQSAMGNLSSEIPGYSNMTPAERVKAKLKVMLEKTSDKLNKEPKSEEQTMTFAPPSAADIARIEGDVFEPASFVSHRTANKDVRSGVGGAKKHFDVTSVDPSEYEPQVVELSDQLIQDTSPDGEDSEGRQKESPREGERGQTSSDVPKDDKSGKDGSLAVASKNVRWLSKLQKLRQQFSSPPTD